MATNGSPLARLLLSHGISAEVAPLILSAGGAMVRESVYQRVEIAAVLDLQTGEPVGPMRTGESSEVDVTALLAAMRGGRSYVALHTHLQSTSFSDRDLEVLLTNEALLAIIAIGWDGSWHILSKTADAPSAPVGVAAFRRALALISPTYLRRVRTGELAPERAFQMALHDLWRGLSKALRLRYDRYRSTPATP